MKMIKLGVIGLSVALLSGCYVDKLKDDASLSNVKEYPRGYVMYDIKAEGVRCREHTKRAELTCWPISNVEAY